LIIAAGYAWRWFNPGGLDRHRVRHALSVTVLYVFMPALAFGLVATARADRNFVLIPLAGAVVVFLCTGVAFAAYHLLPGLRNIPRPAAGVLLLAATYGNVTYLGLPVITEMFGAEYGHVAILYDQLAHTPLLLTVGVFMASRYGGGKPLALAESLKRVLLLPPLWGVALGIAVRVGGVTVPDLLLDTASLMGKAVIPIMTFTVGLALEFRDVQRLPYALPALAIKLLLAPILAWGVGHWFGLDGMVLKATTVEGAMPVMVFLLVIADECELDVPLAATCIAVSTVLLFVTMPMMMGMLF
jgi:predicted permease